MFDNSMAVITIFVTICKHPFRSIYLRMNFKLINIEFSTTLASVPPRKNKQTRNTKFYMKIHTHTFITTIKSKSIILYNFASILSPGR